MFRRVLSRGAKRESCVSDQVKFVLDEKDIPKTWYNLTADLPKPLPPVLHPGTKQPIGPADLEPLFPMELILQEVTGERYLDIPQPIIDVYRMWRPAPLIRARRLEQKLGTPAKIYFKYEGVSPAGSHKPNTAVAQAWYNKQAGVKRLSTETGAGQWGSSLAFAGSLFGIDVTVFQVRVSYDQKPYRRALMETYGARCVASPSNETECGRAILKQHPNSPGSLGIAISEAVEVAAKDPAVKYALGSVLNHVLLHQTIVGQEAIKQFEAAGDDPDVVIGCTGGGSNFAGLAFPFLGLQLRGGRKRRVIAVEPAACPSLTRGKYAYDFGDTAHLTPLVKMHTLGSTFIPPGFHAGGLRYHGMSPLVSHVYQLGLIEARAYHQVACFEAVWNLRDARASCRPRRPHTPYVAPLTRRCAARRRARKRRSSLISPATAISTCRPTSIISKANWSIRTTTRRSLPWRWRACRASLPDWSRQIVHHGNLIREEGHDRAL